MLRIRDNNGNSTLFVLSDEMKFKSFSQHTWACYGSDFYNKSGNVYIEFWGMEPDAKYACRKAVKQNPYADNEFNLIELNDDDVNHLDDILPRKLLQYNINVN